MLQSRHLWNVFTYSTYMKTFHAWRNLSGKFQGGRAGILAAHWYSVIHAIYIMKIRTECSFFCQARVPFDFHLSPDWRGTPEVHHEEPHRHPRPQLRPQEGPGDRSRSARISRRSGQDEVRLHLPQGHDRCPSEDGRTGKSGENVKDVLAEFSTLS